MHDQWFRRKEDPLHVGKNQLTVMVRDPSASSPRRYRGRHSGRARQRRHGVFPGRSVERREPDHLQRQAPRLSAGVDRKSGVMYNEQGCMMRGSTRTAGISSASARQRMTATRLENGRHESAPKPENALHAWRRKERAQLAQRRPRAVDHRASSSCPVAVEGGRRSRRALRATRDRGDRHRGSNRENDADYDRAIRYGDEIRRRD